MLFLLSQCRRMMRRRQMPRDVIIRGESMLPALLPGGRHRVEYRGRSRHALPRGETSCCYGRRQSLFEGCSVVVPQGQVYLLGDKDN